MHGKTTLRLLSDLQKHLTKLAEILNKRQLEWVSLICYPEESFFEDHKKTKKLEGEDIAIIFSFSEVEDRNDDKDLCVYYIDMHTKNNRQLGHMKFHIALDGVIKCEVGGDTCYSFVSLHPVAISITKKMCTSSFPQLLDSLEEEIRVQQKLLNLLSK